MKRFSTLKTLTGLKAKKPWRPERKSLQTRTTLKATKRIKKVGTVGRANHIARTAIATIAEKKDMKRCELGPVLTALGITGCTKTWPLAPAHRHKRSWYKGDADLLAREDQWVAACTCCHDRIEHDSVLTEEVFVKLRGQEL